MTPPTFPALSLAGEPEAIGRAYGKQAAQLIAHNLRLYEERFRHEVGLTHREVLQRAAWWWKRLKQNHPEYAAMVQGVAQGAGAPLLEVVALNVRYELFYSEFSRQGLRAAACTTWALLPQRTANGHLLMGQNWDWFPGVVGLWLEVQQGIHKILGFTEAGIVGPKIGLNSAGLGMVLSGLVSPWDRWDGEGAPLHVLCWRVLVSSSLEEAVHELEGMAMPCSASWTVGQAVGPGQGAAVNVEKAPVGTWRWEPHNGFLVHANHFLAAGQLGGMEPPADERLSTYLRQARMEELLAQRGSAIDEQTLLALLSDHQGFPDSICRHPNPALPAHSRYATLASVVLNLHARKVLYAAGSPCISPWTTRTLE